MKNYSPNKPAKYGMLFKFINDARFSYSSYPYCGTPKSEYYARGTEETVKYLFEQLQSRVDLGAIIFRMIAFTLALDWQIGCLKNVTSVGTLLSSKRGILAE